MYPHYEIVHEGSHDFVVWGCNSWGDKREVLYHGYTRRHALQFIDREYRKGV